MQTASTVRSEDHNRFKAAGRGADTPTQIPAQGWKQVALRTWKQSSDDNIGLVAAGVSFYGLLALVPLLGATVLTYGLVAAPATVFDNVKALTNVMPADAAKLVGEQLLSVVEALGGKKGLGLLLALAVALFGARNAAGSVITALNIAYEKEESRGFLKVNLLALTITAVAALLANAAMIAVAALGHLERLLPNLPGSVVTLGKLGSYALLLAGAAAGAGTLYRYGPNRKKAKWIWITPGSILAFVGWIVLTLGFDIYAANLADYGRTYGSLATVVVLITWMYLSAYILLFGAELNSELEHQTAKDTTVCPSEPIRSRGTWSANHPADRETAEKPIDCHVRAPGSGEAASSSSQSAEYPYLASRLAACAGEIAGGAKVGMLGSVIATIGLSLLRRRGRAWLGAALLGTAAGLALMRRSDEREISLC